MPTAQPESSADTATPLGDPPAPRRRRGRLAVRFAFSFVFGFALALVISAGALYAWSQQFDGRVLPGVRIGATDLGGMTREQVAATVDEAYASFGDGAVTLTGPDGQTRTIDFADVGRGPDTDAIVDAAFGAGRTGEPLATLLGAPKAALHGVTIGAAVTYDREKLAAAVDALAESLDRHPTDAAVRAGSGATFTVSPSEDGRAVDKVALLAAIDAKLAALDAPDAIALDVPMLVVAPAVPTSVAESAKATAERMAADVVITRGTDTWTLPASAIAPLISFVTSDGTVKPVVNEAGLDPLVKSLAKQVNREAKDAGFKLVRGRVIATGSSHEGRTLRKAGMKAAIVNELAARQAGRDATPVAAIVKAIDPKLTKEDAKKFAGKMKMISSYSVFYWVIVNNHFGGNIEGPATAINGTVVPAGEKFDFWKVVGDVSKLPGVGPGNAIVDGKITVTGALGGGICTTSTTLFNAAFRAGMVPLARKNHNEYITRYPAGLDATVWIVGKAKQTMSFLNDTKYPILITRTVTNAPGNKRWLTFKIWSVPNGRVAKVTDTVIKPGDKAKDTIVKDPTKPVGYRFRNNDPADGAQVWVTVSIYDHGKLHWRKRYYSDYPAVDGVLIVGSKAS